MSPSVERTYVGEARRRLSEFSAGVRQMLTKTPEEYVSDAWRSLDPSTHIMSRSLPAKPLVHLELAVSEELRLSRAQRVKFFLDGTLPRVVDKDSACIYSDVALEPCGGLNLKRVRAKWGLYNCQILYRNHAGIYKFVSPRHPDMLNPNELKQLEDREGCLRIIENPPRHIVRYRRYRKALLAECNRWLIASDLDVCLTFVLAYLKLLSNPVWHVARKTKRFLPWGKWVYITLLHVGPLVLAPFLWRYFQGWLAWVPAMSVYLFVSTFLFLQCPASGKSY